MNILLISQCNKRALVETRRVLDQFAERKGERTWQTAITLEGLKTLRMLLKKTARRNTAVACHWIKSNNQSEVIWIVGNIRQFNDKGSVPTNRTGRDILKSRSENQWHSAEAIRVLAAIAGLFHDIGKANRLFQNKLNKAGGPKSKSYEPYRHEWISLRFFQAFVGDKSDQQWLAALQDIKAEDEAAILSVLTQKKVEIASPFNSLPPIAQVVAWLIISHHRLPVYPHADKQSDHYNNSPSLEKIDEWLTYSFDHCWNSTNKEQSWRDDELKAVWQFPHGTPLRSKTWRSKAQKFALRATQLSSLSAFSQLLNQPFTCHMARLTLMLADHYYSSREATAGWHDVNYPVWANTDRKTGALKQALDEHNIGVSQNAYLLGRSLPTLRDNLPAITRHKDFKKRSENKDFRWQDNAYDTACSLRDRSVEQGFFGINMASTGCGKTLANARIMYGLADETRGCRFSIALGLRTLTLQTGDALREKLHLDNDDLAVLIGSQSVQQLHKLDKDDATAKDTGSQSAEALFAEHQYVRYDGSLDDGRLSQWLKSDDKLHKLVSAPILVTTIDHLISATEGTRGGKQIAPMLRLLTSDLVLDEPDDFDINDCHALCRLVNWAGMLGSRVLVSSATLPPALIQALFAAYRAGRIEYQRACGRPGLPVNICCAWFDEFHVDAGDHPDGKNFEKQHLKFISQRVPKLLAEPKLRLGMITAVAESSSRQNEVLDAVAATISQSIAQLSQQHHQTHPINNKTVSVGLVRIANINPLVAVAQRLFAQPSAANTRIHYCVYHSRHPLAVRSYIEKRLDALLMRHDQQALWQVDEVQQALTQYPEQHHIFVVLATSVAEVGRDHDYDWAIAEPSSMRSLIQLAGRVQRHRKQQPTQPNLHILHKNIRALKNESIAYTHPGFETKGSVLSDHDMNGLLHKSQYETITAIPRIAESKQPEPKTNLVDLEHDRLWRELLARGLSGQKFEYAARWWRNNISWCAEMQRRQPFRQSRPQEQHFLWIDDEDEEPKFKFFDKDNESGKESACFIDKPAELLMAAGVSCWIATDYHQVYQQLVDKLNKEWWQVSRQFGELNLPSNDKQRWSWHPLLGVFGALE